MLSEPLELESQAAMGSPNCVLRTKLGKQQAPLAAEPGRQPPVSVFLSGSVARI